MAGFSPILVAVIGGGIGFAADALAHRWPAHEPGYARATFDWRTAAVMAAAAVAFYGLAMRWGTDPIAFGIYFVLFAVLVLLLATDIDQRLLPDVVTLPLVAVSAAALLLGYSPELSGKAFGLISGFAAAVILPALMLILDRVIGGDLGLGDVKLSISLGLLFGLSALFYGLVVASIGFSLVLVVLIGSKRISLKSAVPFGPVLILAAFVAALGAGPR